MNESMISRSGDRDEYDGECRKTVLRITRHPLDESRERFLKEIYGDDVKSITVDIPYGDDPVAAVQALIKRLETNGDKVVAVEAQAPFSMLMKLVERKRDLGVALIRAQFERDANGRAIVVGKDDQGRDLLKFSHYEELEKIEFQTRPLVRSEGTA